MLSIIIIRLTIDTITDLDGKHCNFPRVQPFYGRGHIHRHPLMRERVATHSKVQLQHCWMPRSSEMSGRDSGDTSVCFQNERVPRENCQDRASIEALLRAVDAAATHQYYRAILVLSMDANNNKIYLFMI